MTDAPPEVSVALPAFNAADTLPAALDSLLVQTHPDYEIVVADDGSTDDTPRVLAAYATRHARIRPLYLTHRGVAHAFNSAIDAARGAFVARMDADDLCLPKRLELQAAHLRTHPETGLVASQVRFGGCRETCAGYAHHVDWTNSLTSAEAMRLGRFVDAPFANPTAMFRRELVARHGGARQGDFPEDYEMWLRWMGAGVRMDKLSQALVVWNDPPQRATRTDPRYDPQAFYRVKALYLARWLEKHNPHHPDVVVVGSGRTTRKRSDLLVPHGVRIVAYVEVDPRKIGKAIGGVPVLSRDQMPGPQDCFVLPYVASRGAREEICDMLDARGFRIGREYICVA